MFIGLLLGFIFSFVLILSAFIIYVSLEVKIRTIVICTAISMMLITLLGGYIGYKVDVNEYNKKIVNWKNTKYIIEASIKNENISDLEKIELVNKVVEYNMQLTSLKEDVKQWWNFYLDDSKVNELDIIRID